MKEIRLGLKILFILTKDRIQYPGRLVTDLIGMFARCGILLILYHYVFKLNHGDINGINFQMTAWSIFFYFAFSVLRLRDLSRLIMQDVRGGNVEILFSKPISYVLYRCLWQLGLGLYSFIFVIMFLSAGLFWIIGAPSTMKIVTFLPSLTLVVVFGAILSLLVYAVIGLLAFWIEDILPLYWVVDKSIMILGGSYLPVALFPKYLYWIARYSPLGATHFITHTTSVGWESNWTAYVGIQLFWIFVFLMMVYFLFTNARTKVSVNGG